MIIIPKQFYWRVLSIILSSIYLSVKGAFFDAYLTGRNIAETPMKYLRHFISLRMSNTYLGKLAEPTFSMVIIMNF